jgi:hypothetical protein
MKKLWLLKGGHEAPGWQTLEADSKAEKVDLVIFDRGSWALILDEEAPTKYEGMAPVAPEDGLYVSEQGYPIYVVDRQEVRGPREVVKALGAEAEEMLKKLDDPDAVLQRLGKAF